MKKSLKYREVIGDARRVVVKLGSRVLVQKTGRPDTRRMKHLAAQLAAVQKDGHEVVIVTSGAVGAGMEALGMSERPDTLPDQQMAAAVGQTRLMSRYAEFFGKLKCKVGQILLTHDDFKHKIRLTNAKRTIENLIRNGVIPIINENDVVADEEIRADMALGDNDLLASLVCKLIRADLLILLTTVDGLREPAASGRLKRVKYLESITRKTFGLVHSAKASISKGGMSSKLKSAKSVSSTGCTAIIANGRKNDTITDIMKGKDVGTIVLAQGL
jgi:glutamate 5-kinase